MTTIVHYPDTESGVAFDRARMLARLTSEGLGSAAEAVVAMEAGLEGIDRVSVRTLRHLASHALAKVEQESGSETAASAYLRAMVASAPTPNSASRLKAASLICDRFGVPAMWEELGDLVDRVDSRYHPDSPNFWILEAAIALLFQMEGGVVPPPVQARSQGIRDLLWLRGRDLKLRSRSKWVPRGEAEYFPFEGVLVASILAIDRVSGRARVVKVGKSLGTINHTHDPKVLEGGSTAIVTTVNAPRPWAITNSQKHIWIDTTGLADELSNGPPRDWVYRLSGETVVVLATPSTKSTLQAELEKLAFQVTAAAGGALIAAPIPVIGQSAVGAAVVAAVAAAGISWLLAKLNEETPRAIATHLVSSEGAEIPTIASPDTPADDWLNTNGSEKETVFSKYPPKEFDMSLKLDLGVYRS